MSQLTLPLTEAAANAETLFSIINTSPFGPGVVAAPTIVGTSLSGVGIQGQSGDPLNASAAVEGVNNGNGPGVFGSASANDAVLGHSSSSANAGVAGHNTSTGGVGVYGTGGQYAGKFDGNVKVTGNLNATNANGQTISAVGTDPNNDCINGTSSAAGHAGVSANNTGSGFGLWASSVKGVGVYAKGASLAAQFDGSVLVNGTLTATTDIVLTAADCAEEFDIAADESAEPGTVMVLNETGLLCVSDHAYDTKVAGVISGAGEYRPGLILDKVNSSKRRLPLGLVGKLFCKVDSQYAPIEVGDLLTTSPTPGHAMRAADPIKAFGAVIGKALLPLKSGRGLIPVLIALQ